MSLTTVLSISLIPAKARIYEDGVRRLAERARDQRDAFHWRTYQVVAGQQGVIHFVSQAQDFAELAKRDMTPQALVLRLLGEKEGAKLGEELASCSAASRYTIARERPDLSYPPDSRTEVLPMSVVTVLRTQPPHPRRSRPPAAAHRIAHQSIRCRGRWSDLALRYGGARDGGALDQPAATGSLEPELSPCRGAAPPWWRRLPARLSSACTRNLLVCCVTAVQRLLSISTSSTSTAVRPRFESGHTRRGRHTRRRAIGPHRGDKPGHGSQASDLIFSGTPDFRGLRAAQDAHRRWLVLREPRSTRGSRTTTGCPSRRPRRTQSLRGSARRRSPGATRS